MASVRNEQASHLIDLVYAAALDAQRSRDVLAALSECVQSAAARLVTLQCKTGRVLASETFDLAEPTRRAHEQYVNYWSTRDPRTSLLTALPVGEVLSCHDHFDESFVSGDGCYQDFLLPHGVRWLMAGTYGREADTVNVVATLRGPDAAPFDTSDKMTIKQLLPHLARASVIRTRLASPAKEVAPSELLKRLPMPCLLTDRAGRCLDANQEFVAIMPSLGLKISLGRVGFERPERQARWAASLFETYTTAVGQTISVHEAVKGERLLHLVPWCALTQDADATDLKMILVVVQDKLADSAAPAATPSVAKGRLTRAELEILRTMLHGMSAKMIARTRGGSVNTVRNQIMSILEKTGHHSQRELIAAFGTSAMTDSSMFGQSLPADRGMVAPVSTGPLAARKASAHVAALSKCDPGRRGDFGWPTDLPQSTPPRRERHDRLPTSRL